MLFNTQCSMLVIPSRADAEEPFFGRTSHEHCEIPRRLATPDGGLWHNVSLTTCAKKLASSPDWAVIDRCYRISRRVSARLDCNIMQQDRSKRYRASAEQVDRRKAY